VTLKEIPLFARVKKSGCCEYLRIVENRRAGKKTVQRVISTIGRIDHLHAKGGIETLLRSLSRFSEKALLIPSPKGDVYASGKKIGPGRNRVSRTLYIKITRGYTPPYSIEKNYFIATQKRNLLLRKGKHTEI
jgi:hypothetical protein